MADLHHEGYLSVENIEFGGDAATGVGADPPCLCVTGFKGLPVPEVMCNICCDYRADVQLSPCKHIVCKTCLLTMRQQLVYSPHRHLNATQPYTALTLIRTLIMTL